MAGLGPTQRLCLSYMGIAWKSFKPTVWGAASPQQLSQHQPDCFFVFFCLPRASYVVLFSCSLFSLLLHFCFLCLHYKSLEVKLLTSLVFSLIKRGWGGEKDLIKGGGEI